MKGNLAALALNAFPIDREVTSRKSSDELRRLIDDGWSLVIFPEGGRSPDGWGQEFKGGAAYLAEPHRRAGGARVHRRHRQHLRQGHEAPEAGQDQGRVRRSAVPDRGREHPPLQRPHRGRRHRARRRGAHRLLDGPPARRRRAPAPSSPAPSTTAGAASGRSPSTASWARPANAAARTAAGPTSADPASSEPDGLQARASSAAIMVPAIFARASERFGQQRASHEADRSRSVLRHVVRCASSLDEANISLRRAALAAREPEPRIAGPGRRRPRVARHRQTALSTTACVSPGGRSSPGRPTASCRWATGWSMLTIGAADIGRVEVSAADSWQVAATTPCERPVRSRCAISLVAGRRPRRAAMYPPSPSAFVRVAGRPWCPPERATPLPETGRRSSSARCGRPNVATPGSTKQTARPSWSQS